MKLRQQALEAGLKVREIMDRSTLPEICAEHSGAWLEYSMVLPPKSELDTDIKPWKRVREAADDDFFLGWPVSVVRVALRSDCVAVLWSEKGDAADVDGLINQLAEIAEMHERKAPDGL